MPGCHDYGSTENVGVGRKGQREAGEVLYAHAPGHGHRRDLRDLNRPLADHVTAQDRMCWTVDYQFAEADGPTVNDGPRHCSVLDFSNDNLVRGACLRLRQSDLRVFRVGETPDATDL